MRFNKNDVLYVSDSEEDEEKLEEIAEGPKQTRRQGRKRARRRGWGRSGCDDRGAEAGATPEAEADTDPVMKLGSTAVKSGTAGGRELQKAASEEAALEQRLI